MPQVYLSENYLHADDISVELRKKALENNETFQLTDIIIKKENDYSYNFYGLHEIKDDDTKKKAFKIATEILNYKIKMLPHLAEDIEKEKENIKTKLIDGKKYLWISYLSISNKTIKLYSAGRSKHKDGLKLFCNAIRYLQTNAIDKIDVLRIGSLQHDMIETYKKIGFDMEDSKSNFETDIKKLRTQDINLFLIK
jgi:hypothetical protein